MEVTTLSEILSGTLNQTLGYTYNNDFNLTGFTYAGGTTNYAYDSDGLLTGAGAFTINRDAANGLPKAVTGGALSLTRAFNGYGEVEGQDFNIGGSSLTSWSLTRDDAGRITQKQETVGGTTSNYAYTYDPMGRLLTVTKDGELVEEYEYGPNGARTAEMNILRGISPRTFTYSDEDHLLTAGNTTYQYDPDGFLVTKTEGTNVTQYAYSSRGELLQVILPDGKTIDYLHDPLGRRIAKVVDGIITEKYLWQGLTSLLAVYDGSDNLLRRFEYADARMPVAMTSAGSTYYITYDQVGSLRIITDASGNVLKRVDYDSFGNIIDDSNPDFTVPFGFAGGLHDRDTGFVRFGKRDYDPDIGRWTAKDPIRFWGGDTDLYGYCLNNPVNFIDSNGLDLWFEPFDPAKPCSLPNYTCEPCTELYLMCLHDCERELKEKEEWGKFGRAYKLGVRSMANAMASFDKRSAKWAIVFKLMGMEYDTLERTQRENAAYFKKIYREHEKCIENCRKLYLCEGQ